MINRRHFVTMLFTAAIARTALAAEPPLVTVYLNPT